jgi:iron complex transport system ATP-binding protein
VVLGAGRVLAEGAPEDVLTPATIREAFGVEARVERVAGSLVVIPDDPE